MPIKFSCPHCQRIFTVSDELGGKTIMCQNCRKSFVVPFPYEPEDAQQEDYSDKGYGTGYNPNAQPPYNQGQYQQQPPYQEQQPPYQGQPPYPQQHQQPPYPGQQYPPYQPQPRMRAIPTYLAQSILVTLLCCLPFGIVAIVYAASVNGKQYSGDIAGAIDASRKAKFWSWLGFWFGLIGVILYALFVGTATASFSSW